jgi:hypothetical protein
VQHNHSVSVRRIYSPPPGTLKDWDDDKNERDKDVDFGNFVDPSQAWCAGAVPVACVGEVAFIWTSVGATLTDALGSPVSMVAQSVAAALGGRFCQVSNLAEPRQLGGAGPGSALRCSVTQQASFNISVH